MVEFDVSMFAFVREGIRYTRHKTSLCPAAVTGIYRHNPGHKKRGLREWLEKAIQNHPPKWRLLFFPWLYPTSSRCSSFVAVKFSMLHIPLHGTHHAISCPLPRTSSPTHGWESVLRWHWGFRHGESPHFTMFGQWSLISLFLLHCCCGEGCVFLQPGNERSNLQDSSTWKVWARDHTNQYNPSISAATPSWRAYGEWSGSGEVNMCLGQLIKEWPSGK